MEVATAPAGLKDEFRNETKGFVGVITIDPQGNQKGVAVRPGNSIWLSEAEQILTANAPRLDKDNPFTNGQLSLLTKAGDVKNRRPIGDAAPSSAGQAPAEEVAPSDGPVSEPPRVEKDGEQGSEGNAAPPPEPAKAVSDRAAADAARVKAERQKATAAQKQAAQGATPAKAPPAEPTRSGVPKAAPQGSRPEVEEVGTPE